MVKITFSPISEVVVHEVVKIGYDDLLRSRITPAGSMPLYWCDGVLFSFNSMPMTKDIIKDYLNGRIHWMEVHYCEMKKYQEILDLNDDAYKATMHVRVIDTSSSALHTDLIKWLKSKR